MTAPGAGAEPLGVLLLGFSGLAHDQDHQQDMYLPAVSAHDGFRVVAVTGHDDGSGEPAERVAGKLGVPYVADWRAAVAAEDVDVVSVCVPLGQRAEVISAVLRAGKHVLADKPLAADAVAAASVAQAAAETGRVVVPAHHLRFHRTLLAARDAVAGGKVGLPWNVQADFLIAGGTPAEAGELLNFAVYPVDAILAMTGQRVRRVYASTARHWDAPPGANDFALLSLTHDNGLTSTISVGRMRALADTPPAGLAVHRYRVSGSHGVLEVDVARPAVTVRTGTYTQPAWHGPATLHLLLDELRAAIRQGRPATPGPDDAVQVADIIDAARQSASTGSPVDLAGMTDDNDLPEGHR